MIPLTAKRASIFEEFTPEEQNEFFSIKSKQVLPHIDNIYYGVYIVNDKAGQETPKEIQNLLLLLSERKAERRKKFDSIVTFHDLNVEPTGFSIYEYRLSYQEHYDIFISSYIPNEDTPRILIQLRTRYMVLFGEHEALTQSYQKACDLLSAFGLIAGEARENRLDFAYHTNLIQSFTEYFGTEKLKDHVVSDLRKFSIVGTIGHEVDISYLSLGMRKSNNLFFRAYDKTREVIEQGYKSFFLDRWLEYNLISQYDYEVYLVAYELKSYGVGCCVGRIKWYLAHGKNETLKEKLSQLLKTCFEKNSNSDELRKKLKGILPNVTKICNIEFETKRKFYASMDDFFNTLKNVKPTLHGHLFRLDRILQCRQIIHDCLTKSKVTFVEDRANKETKYLDWWDRIANIKVGSITSEDFYRKYNRLPDMDRARKNLTSAIAYYSMLINESTAEKSFVEDLSDVMSNLNDNNFYGFACDPMTGEVNLDTPRNYEEQRRRKAHQNKGVIHQFKEITERRKDLTIKGYL